MTVALEMIRVAAACGVDIVKFQKRNLVELPEDVGARPRVDVHSFGDTELRHRQALEFGIAQHGTLRDACARWGVQYGCSAWDETSFNELVGLGVEYVKIPSAKNQEFQNWKMSGKVPLHASLGMLSRPEREKVLGYLSTDDVPYACTSKYPCRMEDVYLFELNDLNKRFSRVGFSGHHNGIAVDLGAALFGAAYIERHFTLDRTSKGTDHAASLEPAGLMRVARDLKALWKALKDKPDGLPACEIETRKKMKGY